MLRKKFLIAPAHTLSNCRSRCGKKVLLMRKIVLLFIIIIVNIVAIKIVRSCLLLLYQAHTPSDCRPRDTEKSALLMRKIVFKKAFGSKKLHPSFKCSSSQSDHILEKLAPSSCVSASGSLKILKSSPKEWRVDHV